jgi:prepilin-type N-terminal cleavage/methylation domain-containing protein
VLKNNQKISNAFTLVELLVVISIMAILVSMITVSFTSSQKQARDTQRKSDLTQYRTALEAYANRADGFFPIHASVVDADSICGATELNLTNCPIDPKDGTGSYGYKYISDANGTNYGLYGILEYVSTNYWVVCSNGTSLLKTSGTPSLSDCP